ncbi:arginase [Helicobacter sp. 12S02232-10]|nr:arginase [Helicobacter sp. 12S02232-10]
MQLVEIYSDIGASKRGSAKGVGLLDDMLKQNHKSLIEKALKIINDCEILEDRREPDYSKNIQTIYKFFKEKLIPTMNEVILSGKFPVILSGDHSNALGTLSAFKNAYAKESIGIIWVDAHSDLHTPYDTSSGNIHGMPLGGVLNVVTSGENSLQKTTMRQWEELCSLGTKINNIKPQNIVYVGVRSMEKSEREMIEKFKIPLYAIAEIRQDIPLAIAKIAAYLKDVDRIYLSVDADVLDGKIFTSTGVRENNGLYPAELDTCIGLLIEKLGQKLIALEFTEFNPALKDSNPKDDQVLLGIISRAISKLERMGE